LYDPTEIEPGVPTDITISLVADEPFGLELIAFYVEPVAGLTLDSFAFDEIISSREGIDYISIFVPPSLQAAWMHLEPPDIIITDEPLAVGVLTVTAGHEVAGQVLTLDLVPGEDEPGIGEIDGFVDGWIGPIEIASGHTVDLTILGVPNDDETDDGEEAQADEDELGGDLDADEEADSEDVEQDEFDSDGDGVPDDLDLCSDTLPANEPDSMGCSAVQQDLDGDGVSIDLDDCPDSRIGERVNANGCSVTQIDIDADGVADVFDRCLGTPSDQDADEVGCSDWQLADDDDDGVANYRDECSQTAPGEVPDAFGCSCTEFDDDSDGVLNCDDFCPESPAGDQIDANGCACSQLDEDGDDVSNCDDQCPGTLIGLRVDEFGCSASDDPRALDVTATAPLPSACGALGIINFTLMLSALSLLSRPFRRFAPKPARSDRRCGRPSRWPTGWRSC
jgi:hypothetical protein